MASPSNKISQITLCIRNVLNNKLLHSQYNKIVQQKFLLLFELDLRGIWDKIQHLYYSHAEVHIMIVPWLHLVNLCRSPKSPKNP